RRIGRGDSLRAWVSVRGLGRALEATIARLGRGLVLRCAPEAITAGWDVGRCSHRSCVVWREGLRPMAGGGVSCGPALASYGKGEL
ncbi:unnamed protein product, partial [Dovyalis caffra]